MAESFRVVEQRLQRLFASADGGASVSTAEWDVMRILEFLMSRAQPMGVEDADTLRLPPVPEVIVTSEANLGLATTMELIQEIASRIAVDYSVGGGGLNYTTVHGRPDSEDQP